MIFDDADDCCEIRESEISGAGRGLFAKRAFAKDDCLQVNGVLIDRHSIADDCTRYADQYKFRIGDKLLIPTGYAALLNHSYHPNMEKIIEGTKVFLRALRDILPGEELVFCYSEYAREKFGLK